MNVSGFYVVKGDSTCDGRITLEDRLVVNAHILGTYTLTEDAFIGADVNGDGKVSIVDDVAINRHLAGTLMITGVVAK